MGTVATEEFTQVRCMHPIRLFLCLVLTLLAAEAISAQSWELDWSDEFDYTGLPDSTRWSYDVGGHGWGNQELQFYTEAREQNARVDGEVLIIEAHKESGFARNYTSARLVSKGKGDWTYGRIEVRAQLPQGRGTWPAIWMLSTRSDYGNGGWPDTGEIDIMEHVGHDPNVVHATVHTDRYNHLMGSQRGGSKTVSGATQGFHDYAAEWSPTKIEFLIDGVVFFRYHNDYQGWSTWPFDRPFHLIMNVAIGGSWGGQQGVDDSIFPQQMAIDYVRVYRYAGYPSVSVSAPERLAAGDELAIRAEATDPDGAVQRVTFMQGDGVLATHIAAPYAMTIHNVHAGCYTLRSVAVDDGGWAAYSDTLALKVGTGPCGQAPYLIAPHAIPGSIEAEYFDLGGQGVAYADLTPTNDNGGLRQDEGVDVGFTTDGQGHDVDGISRREWLEYTVHVEQSGEYTLEARVATTGPGTTASFALEFDGDQVTDPIVHESRSLGVKWETVRRNGIRLTEGPHKMRIRMQSAGFRMNWIRFVLDSPTSSEEVPESEQFVLYENYPNPFTTSTRLSFGLDTPGHVTLDIFNALGQHIVTLVDRHHTPGRHDVVLNAAELSTGVYYSRLVTPTGAVTRPILLVRH